MSGPCEMMVWCSPPRLKLMLPMVLLVVFTNTVSLHGNTVTAVNHNLQCVSDYESLINCSLNIAPSPNSSESNSSYWLTVMETDEKERCVCMLVKNGADYFCSVQISNPMTDSDFESNEFLEQDIFEISLCHDQNDGVENCDLLTAKFIPFKNIKPNPPCCLTLSHQSGQHLFTWESTYEKYSLITTMAEELMFQLHFYKRGDEFSIISHRIINTDITNYSVADDKFLSDTEYCARVRSSPNQEYFEGQWSSWSSEIYWRTKPDVNVNTFMSGLGKKVFITLSVMVLLALLLCYGQVKKWRQSSFIPTPAPYFHTLYSDCHGDFKIQGVRARV
ncbi:interleukin-9 receptor isoform X2 [Notolabrus celidotus]|uniref:interleukin-9 receptor isoform X2 n=1 Tax=Notolabrus celidotus TaxID=1203425 RepID=UPI00148FD3B4|nr:interleukin-9 receptor isoform X2 [Notolabrus celidotus]